MEIKKGLIFTGKWFKGRIEVLYVNESANELEVWLNNPNSEMGWGETWDLQVVKQGFVNGDYFL